MFSKTSSKTSLISAKESKMKKKQGGTDSGITFFEKAKSLFPLDKRVEPATERDWEMYITNRLTAEKRFRGPKERKKKSSHDQGEDDVEEYYGDSEEEFVLNMIRENMAVLEEDLDLNKGVLRKSFRLLSCDALFEEEDEPRTVTMLTRIYSPTRPVYIDVHFQYHCRPRYDSVEWYYTLGFKIHKRPGTNDYHPSEIKKYENGRFDRAYTGNGWRSIAYGFYDDSDDYGRDWRRIENSEFALGEDEVMEVYEALWGAMEELPEDDDEDVIADAEADRRFRMISTVRVLMAAAGIGYYIAVDDDEEDDAGNVLMLEGLSDRWFARGVRKACGFQLARDPENAKKGEAERKEEATRRDDDDDDDDEYDSEEGIFNPDDDDDEADYW